jgi:hypothetical protein
MQNRKNGRMTRRTNCDIGAILFTPGAAEDAMYWPSMAASKSSPAGLWAGPPYEDI